MSTTTYDDELARTRARRKQKELDEITRKYIRAQERDADPEDYPEDDDEDLADRKKKRTYSAAEYTGRRDRLIRTNKDGSAPDSKDGLDKTRDTLKSILSAVAMSLATLVFVYFFARSPTMVLVGCCGYIVLYCVFIVYVMNQVDACFKDNTLVTVTKWTTILAMVFAVMIGIATVAKENRWFDGGRGGDPRIKTSDGYQAYPDPRQQGLNNGQQPNNRQWQQQRPQNSPPANSWRRNRN